MIKSLTDIVEEIAREKFGLRGRREGQPGGGWVVLDLGDIVIHIFSPDQREYYRLEQLWEKGKTLLHLQ
jgi:ribosome-associated protein